MARGSRGNRPSRRELAELIRRAMKNRAARHAAHADHDAVPEPPAAVAAVAAPLTRAEQWLAELKRIRRSLPPGLSDWYINQNAKFDIKRIYRNGEIQATCSYKDQLLEVFADCSGNHPQAGCS